MTTLSFESGSGGSSSGQLLRDIEEISKALYLPKSSRRPLISFLNLQSESTQNTHLPYPISKPDHDEEKINRDKRSSVWPWKPLKAISHIWRRKFNCCFFCHVHHIQSLPSTFDGLDIRVHWRRNDDPFMTQTSRVSNGLVEFEDTLMSKCSIYGAKSGQGNFVKYEPKHFLLYASVVGLEGLDIGKHWIDLTRLLPLMFEELEDEDKSSGKWTTSFKLEGEAEGATVHVSFGFLVMNKSFYEFGNGGRSQFHSKQNGLGIVETCRYENASGMLRRVETSSSSSLCLDVNVLHQVWPNPRSEFPGSIDFLYRKLDENNMCASREFNSNFENSASLHDNDDGVEFTVTEKGMELDWIVEEQLKLAESAAGKMDCAAVEVMAVAEIFKDEVNMSDQELKLDPITGGSGGSVTTALLCKDSCSCEMELTREEWETDICNMFISKSVDSESLAVGGEEICEGVKSNPRMSKMVDLLTLDVFMKAVEDDFINLLGETDDPCNSSHTSDHESPRERLWRGFENDVTASEKFLFDSDAPEDEAEFCCLDPASSCSDSTNEDTIQLAAVHTATLDLTGNQSTRYKTKPKMLEWLEAQSLMQRWGFNEEAFESSPDSCSSGFGSPIYLAPDEPEELPPLGEGLGPLLQLNDGGFLRSMSPSLFEGCKNGGNLIIQVSRPVVLPAYMSSEILEVLQCMASGGLEMLSKEVHQLMPLDDLSGKVIQQLAWEASCLEAMSERQKPSEDEAYVKLKAWGSSSTLSGNGFSLTSIGDGSGCEHISIENLVPLVMNSIESLSIEGLKIQSSMSDMVAHSSIKLNSDSDHSGFRKISDCVKFSEKEGARLQHSTLTSTRGNIESLMGLSLSLDEWLRLDSGNFGSGDHVSENTSKLLAAHHAKSCLFESGKLVQDNSRKNASMKCGLLGDDLVISLMVQLRDPLRNFESVGTPMLSVIRVKREFHSPGPVIHSEKSMECTQQETEMGERLIYKSFGGDCTARLVLKEVNVAGLVAAPGNEEIWATRRQQQLGSRWLLANRPNNMTKRHNHKSLVSKSNAILRLSRVLKKQQSQNILWSISHDSQGFGDHLNQFNVDPYLRNPDIIFS